MSTQLCGPDEALRRISNNDISPFEKLQDGSVRLVKSYSRSTSNDGDPKDEVRDLPLLKESIDFILSRIGDNLVQNAYDFANDRIRAVLSDARSQDISDPDWLDYLVKIIRFYCLSSYLLNRDNEQNADLSLRMHGTRLNNQRLSDALEYAISFFHVLSKQGRKLDGYFPSTRYRLINNIDEIYSYYLLIHISEPLLQKQVIQTVRQLCRRLVSYYPMNHSENASLPSLLLGKNSLVMLSFNISLAWHRQSWHSVLDILYSSYDRICSQTMMLSNGYTRTKLSAFTIAHCWCAIMENHADSAQRKILQALSTSIPTRLRYPLDALRSQYSQEKLQSLLTAMNPSSERECIDKNHEPMWYSLAKLALTSEVQLRVSLTDSIWGKTAKETLLDIQMIATQLQRSDAAQKSTSKESKSNAITIPDIDVDGDEEVLSLNLHILPILYLLWKERLCNVPEGSCTSVGVGTAQSPTNCIPSPPIFINFNPNIKLKDSARDVKDSELSTAYCVPLPTFPLQIGNNSLNSILSVHFL